MKPASCSKLRCTKCDKRVVRFSDDVRWKASVDYLFVRNHNTNVSALREGTQGEAGSSAYACQCHWLSVSAQTRVESLVHHWHCGGH
jgi:hypothetical protein